MASESSAGRILHVRDRLVQCSFHMDRDPQRALRPRYPEQSPSNLSFKLGTRSQLSRPAFTRSGCVVFNRRHSTADPVCACLHGFLPSGPTPDLSRPSLASSLASYTAVARPPSVSISLACAFACGCTFRQVLARATYHLAARPPVVRVS